MNYKLRKINFKNMKYLQLFIVLFAFTNILYANNGAIKGTVINPEGAPLQAVTIRLMELKKQTSTNAKGEFQFEDVPKGKYSLKLSRAGCRPIDTVLHVPAGAISPRFTMYDVYRIKENIVVTGTRTAKQIESNPIATDVVTSESIQSASRLRLDNVLNEELGMVLVESHGKGIQIQGLDPDYALILLNGEPLIGRNGGILDLKRLSMGNIQRVEVVKGPSSSLYGSNALAGVINLITNEADKPFSLRANARYESFNTIDFGTEIGLTNQDNMIGNNFFINRLSSDGFKLTDERYGKAVPEYVNYSVSNDFFYKFNYRTSAKIGVRFNSEDQVNWFNVTQNDIERKVDDNSRLRDYGISISSKHQYNELHNVEARAYYTKYQTETIYTFQDDGSRYDRYTFDQSLAKIELQTNRMLAMKHILTFGGGYVYEDVAAQRLNDGIVTANSFFAFLQEVG